MMQVALVDQVTKPLAGINAQMDKVSKAGRQGWSNMAMGATTVAAGGKAGVGEVGGTIACGGVAVNEGDMIVGDADGVVVVPADKAKDVFALAAEKESKDAERAARILQDADSVRRHLDQVLGL